MKKEGDGKRGKKRRRKDDHSTRKLKGYATYRCKFDKEWSKKNLALSQSKKTPMLFFGQFAHRKLVVHIKLFVMLSDTVKQFFILSLEMK